MKLIAKRLIREGKVDEVIELYRELAVESRKEEGCVSYELFRDTKEKRLLAVIEEWRSIADLELHRQTPHYQKLVPMVSAMAEQFFDLETYDKIL